MPETFAQPAPQASGFHYKPSRAEIARANGACSRGPVTAAGKARSRLNGLVHGLRARSQLPVQALGESGPELAAQAAAVCHELGAVGPTARHLAETVACAILRAARAERLEGELLQGFALGVAASEGTITSRLHEDVDARASLALLQRYRRDADRDLLNALSGLVRLQAARAHGLLPDEETAAEAEAELAQSGADEPVPSEPRITRILTAQELDTMAAEAVLPDPACYDGAAVLRHFRAVRARAPEAANQWWLRLPDAAARAALAAHKAEGG